MACCSLSGQARIACATEPIVGGPGSRLAAECGGSRSTPSAEAAIERLLAVASRRRQGRPRATGRALGQQGVRRSTPSRSPPRCWPRRTDAKLDDDGPGRGGAQGRVVPQDRSELPGAAARARSRRARRRSSRRACSPPSGRAKCRRSASSWSIALAVADARGPARGDLAAADAARVDRGAGRRPRRGRAAARRAVARSEAGPGRASRSPNRQPAPSSCSTTAAACRTPIARRCSTSCCRCCATKGDAAAGKVVFKKQCAKCHMHSRRRARRSAPTSPAWRSIPSRSCSSTSSTPAAASRGTFASTRSSPTTARCSTACSPPKRRRPSSCSTPRARSTPCCATTSRSSIASTKSLMPEGFEKQVTPRRAGEPARVPHAARQVPAAAAATRSATVVSTRGMFYSEDAPVERLIFADWSPKTFDGVPFHARRSAGRPRAERHAAARPARASSPPQMPKTVTLPCNAPAKAIHLLCGVSGWGFPRERKGTRVADRAAALRRRQDARTTSCKNGEHFADYIRRVDVPGSKFAFDLRGQQVRYLAVTPQPPGRDPRDRVRQRRRRHGPDRHGRDGRDRRRGTFGGESNHRDTESTETDDGEKQ